MKANRSKTYIMPLLFKVINFDIKYFMNIDNVYIRDLKNEYKDCIFLKMSYEENEKSIEFEKELISNKAYRTTIRKDNSTIFVFKFPNKYMKEYRLFKKSKYSEFGADAKVYIMNFWEDFSNSPRMKVFYKKLKGILYKEKELKEHLEEELNVTLHKEAELGELIIIADESIELNKIEYE